MQTLTNSIIPSIVFSIIIFLVYTTKYLGRPRNISLGLYLPKAELSITCLTELTTLKCLGRGHDNIQLVHKPPASSRAWQGK